MPNPRKAGKTLLLVTAALLLLGRPAAACGFYMSGWDMAALLGLFLAVTAPLTILPTAGLICALRLRRRGPTYRRAWVCGVALLLDASLSASLGWNSAVGILFTGAGLIETVLLVAAAVAPAARPSLAGRCTPLFDERLFAALPR